VDEDFLALKARHFDPLCRSLGLLLDLERGSQGFAVASAALDNVRVYFESNRGLCSFGVGSSAQTSSLCGVGEIAGRFPRIRLLPEGEQRLTLEEQAEFVTKHWDDLQIMFSPDHIRETLKWKSAAATALTKRCSRDT
jgi:hypothetical protein